MPFCISPQIIFDAVMDDGLSIAYYKSLYLSKKHGHGQAAYMFVACVCVLFWTWQDTVATQRP